MTETSITRFNNSAGAASYTQNKENSMAKSATEKNRSGQLNDVAESLAKIREIEARKKQIIQRISERRADHEQAVANKGRLSLADSKAAESLRNYRARFDDEKQLSRGNADELHELERRADEARRALDGADAEMQKINAEILHLQKVELPACEEQPASERDLEALRQEITVAQRTVSEIEERIATARVTAQLASDSVPSLASLRQRREDLLADIATGNADEADLERLDAEIAAADAKAVKARAQARLANERAGQTVKGLERRLAPARERLQALREEHEEFRLRVLDTEAQKACAQYVNAALIVKERFLQLVALDGIIKGSNKTRSSLLGSNWNELFLPTFRLSQCAELSDDRYEGGMFSGRTSSVRGLYADAHAAEFARLRGLGILD